LLVLDEPTANLDPAGMREVFAVLDRLRAEVGTTIVLVEHRVDELADRVSRVVMMEAGRIVFDGTPRQAFARHRTTTTTDGGTLQSTGAWFPQLAEFALELAAAAGQTVDPAWIPLNQPEALDRSEQILARTPATSNRAACRVSEAPPTVQPLLTVNDLRFGYDTGQAVLDGVSFTLLPATMVALLGRNGSGKTTLARTLMGINPPPKAAVSLQGRDLAALGPSDVAAEIGYVFQNPDHQFVTDRVDEEVAYGLRVRGWSDAAITERVDDVLSVVDLDRYRGRSPFSLSLGERRRLSVATVLALEPKLVILDEPTIGQDHERAKQLMGLMQRLRQRYQSTILMITHDVRLVADWSDRAIVLGDGRVRFDGTPADLFAEAELLREVGLIPPPLQLLSAELARRHPQRVPHATLVTDELVRWLVEA
jgi:energy-coupling factor transport system ATP-binding protein